ncbi:MAG: fructose PTS transporter subunit IIB, partial [Cryobacterium sp.]|nr:fructose PTS transporter subunit IIB [Cryobacterium sp.]
MPTNHADPTQAPGQPSSHSTLILAITACPTGIAHTYMAAEKLESAAATLGYELKVETHGSVGIEGTFSQDEIDRADAIVIAADTQVDLSRFAGKRLVSARVADGIHRPQELIADALAATPRAPDNAGSAPAAGAGSTTGASD